MFEFDPPLHPEGYFLVRTLEDAGRFLRKHKHPRLVSTRDSVLRQVERANNDSQSRVAADLFRLWAESEGLLPRRR